MTKLNDFLSDRGISKSAFAMQIGTTAATVSRIGDGIVMPRKALLRRIHESTGGLVTPNDVLGLYCTHPCPNAKLKVSDG